MRLTTQLALLIAIPAFGCSSDKDHGEDTGHVHTGDTESDTDTDTDSDTDTDTDTDTDVDVPDTYEAQNVHAGFVDMTVIVPRLPKNKHMCLNKYLWNCFMCSFMFPNTDRKPNREPTVNRS